MNEWRFRKPKTIFTLDIHWACIERTSNRNTGPNFVSGVQNSSFQKWWERKIRARNSLLDLFLSYLNGAIYSLNELSLRTKFVALNWFPFMCGIEKFGCDQANIPHLSNFCIETTFYAITSIYFKQLQRKFAINVYSSVIVRGLSAFSFIFLL